MCTTLTSVRYFQFINATDIQANLLRRKNPNSFLFLTPTYACHTFETSNPSHGQVDFAFAMCLQAIMLSNPTTHEFFHSGLHIASISQARSQPFGAASYAVLFQVTTHSILVYV